MNVHVGLFASENFKRQQQLQSEEFKKLGLPEAAIHLRSPNNLGDDFFRDIPYANETNRFGHFSFKPYFLENVLNGIPEGDLLFYLDANDKPLKGMQEYAIALMSNNDEINIVSAGTSYPNSAHYSWFHQQRSPLMLSLLSHIYRQPEAGALIIRNVAESRALMRTWYALTMLHSKALLKHGDLFSRHDQETLFQLATLNNSIRVESWIKHRILGTGLRRYIQWEFYREAV